MFSNLHPDLQPLISPRLVEKPANWPINWELETSISPAYKKTRGKCAKARDIGQGYKFYYYWVTNSQKGLVILISKKLHDNVVEVRFISDSLMLIKINTRSVILLCPQIWCTDAEREEFLHQVDDHLQSINISEHLLIVGNLNGHAGASWDGYEQVHSGQGYLIRNKEGGWILDGTEAHDLVVANTFFRNVTPITPLTPVADVWLRLTIGLYDDDDQPVQTLWANVTKKIHDAAGECLVMTKTGWPFIDKQVWWWTNEVQEATKAKKVVVCLSGSQQLARIPTTNVESKEDSGYRKSLALCWALRPAWYPRRSQPNLQNCKFSPSLDPFTL